MRKSILLVIFAMEVIALTYRLAPVEAHIYIVEVSRCSPNTIDTLHIKAPSISRFYIDTCNPEFAPLLKNTFIHGNAAYNVCSFKIINRYPAKSQSLGSY